MEVTRFVLKDPDKHSVFIDNNIVSSDRLIISKKGNDVGCCEDETVDLNVYEVWVIDTIGEEEHSHKVIVARSREEAEFKAETQKTIKDSGRLYEDMMVIVRIVEDNA